MKRLICSVCVAICFALLGCQNQSQPEPRSNSSDAETQTLKKDPRLAAIAAKEALFRQLSGRLAEVIQSKGPAAAIEVCNREAAEIAESVGEEHGVRIGRTALKLRNSLNGSPDWVKPMIEGPSSEPQFVDLPNGHTGVLLPIKLRAQCVICHGPSDRIAEDVKTQLTKLYPNDQATGFKEGDLRGWFWVDVP